MVHLKPSSRSYSVNRSTPERRSWGKKFLTKPRERIHLRFIVVLAVVQCHCWYCCRRRNCLTNGFHVAVGLFSYRSQMTSKCGKNKKVAREAIAECVTDVLTTF